MDIHPTRPAKSSFGRLVAIGIALPLLSLLCVSAGKAQGIDFHKLMIEFGGGVTPTLGQTSADLSTGWNALAGVGFNVDSHLGARVELMYNHLGVTSAALRALNVPGGNAHIWSLTFDPVLRLGAVGPFDPYVIVGGGYYRRTVQFTRPTTTVVTIFNPWWGYLGPAVVPANQVLGTVTQNAGGANAGIGMDVGLGHGTKFFVEARYHYIWTNRATEILPITFGFRW